MAFDVGPLFGFDLVWVLGGLSGGWVGFLVHFGCRNITSVVANSGISGWFARGWVWRCGWFVC